MTQPATAASTGSRSAGARRRRRRNRSGYLVVVLLLTVLGGAYAGLAPSSRAATSEEQSLAVREGRALFLEGCSTCHGLNAEGTNQGPSLIGVGAAAVDFQVSTGRMPLAQPGPQADRKPRKYDRKSIDQLAAYVASLAPGPPIPVVDLEDADLQLGNQLFRTNCASCHNFAGSGGALSYGKYAPPLAPATPVQIAEAMRTGPEQMPVFGPSQLSDFEVNSIVAYVTSLNDEPNPGGHGLARLGPVPEGLVAWVVGITVLVGVTLWIGARA